MKLSVVISAFNEEKKIATCLKSVQWADEIVIVDNSSTDKTLEIAKRYTKNVYTQVNNPSQIDIQKNFGIDKATGDWLLIVDGDEVVTPELASEIRDIINKKESPSTSSESESINGFWIPRKNIIFGKWIEHTGWYPDPQLRLFKRGKGRFVKKHVHEPINVIGETANLKENLLHHNYESVSQFLYKHLQVYALNEAEDLLSKGYVFDYKDAIRFPFKEFLGRYFAREGYRDGLHGLALSLLMSFYHFAIFLYLWEKKDFIEVVSEDLKQELGAELKKAKGELGFWISKNKIEEEKSEFKKIGMKLKRKLHL